MELCIFLHTYNLKYYDKRLCTEILKSSLDNSNPHHFSLIFISKFYTNGIISLRVIDDSEASNMLPIFNERILETLEVHTDT